MLKAAKAECARARVAFPVVKGKEKRGRGRAICSLVALDSLVRRN